MENNLDIDYPLCVACGKKHPPDLPHAANSPQFHTWFAGKHGRAPTYEDSYAHCDEHLKGVAREFYQSLGRDPKDLAEIEWSKPAE